MDTLLIIYLIGCSISLLLNGISVYTSWKEFGKENKKFVFAIWIPTIVIISWLGVILFLFLGCVSNCKKKDNEK